MTSKIVVNNIESDVGVSTVTFGSDVSVTGDINGYGRMVLETSKASTSGTSIDFTGLPSWVKRITVMFSGVSTNGTSNLLIQLGDSGGVETTGYAGVGVGFDSTGTAATSYTTGFGIRSASSTASVTGQATISLISANQWSAAGVFTSSVPVGLINSGAKTLSDTLTQVRITTVNGTDTFDAGSINLLLEGY